MVTGWEQVRCRNTNQFLDELLGTLSRSKKLAKDDIALDTMYGGCQ